MNILKYFNNDYKDKIIQNNIILIGKFSYAELFVKTCVLELCRILYFEMCNIIIMLSSISVM